MDGARIISYNLNEDERPSGVKIRMKIRVESGRKGRVIDARQAEAIREYLGPVPVTLVGRTSTATMQDPVESISRQIRIAAGRLPEGFYIARYYWDMESGGIDLDLRSRTGAAQQYTAVGIPATAAWPTCAPPSPPGTRRSRR
jgi:hypothetical protein